MAKMDSRDEGVTSEQVRDALADAAEKDSGGLALELPKSSEHPLTPEILAALTEAIAKVEDDRRKQPVFIPANMARGDNNFLDGTPLPPRPSDDRTTAFSQELHAENVPSIPTVTEIFSESIKGFDVVIERGAHGDAMRVLAGNAILLEITASQISTVTYSDRDLMLQRLAKSGTTIGNYTARAHVYDGRLSLAVELHPLRIPRSLADAGKLALVWLGLLAQLKIPFIERRHYCAEGKAFKEVQYPPGIFEQKRDPVQLTEERV